MRALAKRRRLPSPKLVRIAVCVCVCYVLIGPGQGWRVSTDVGPGPVALPANLSYNFILNE